MSTIHKKRSCGNILLGFLAQKMLPRPGKACFSVLVSSFFMIAWILNFKICCTFFFFLAAGTGINNSRPKQGQSREKDITYKSTSFHLESLSVRWQVWMNSISLDFPASFSVLKQQSSVVRGRFTKWRDDVWMCFENLCLVSNFPHRLYLQTAEPLLSIYSL